MKKNSVKVTVDSIEIDAQLLFQRLTTLASRHVDNVEDIFKYEFRGVPSSLFDGSGLLREAQKSSLADAIWKTGTCGVKDELDVCQDFVHVIDRGSLLQTVTWKKDVSFETIFEQFFDYI
jgi:hypothetical protein